MSRRMRGVLVAVFLVGIAGITYWHINGMLQRGEPVFWLEVLWAPSAVLSIGLVSCLEFLMAPAAQAEPKVKKTRK